MHRRGVILRILGLLLVVLFLGAQFHYCSDLSTDPSRSHLCPFCSATTSAVAAQAPAISVASQITRAEVPDVVFTVSAVSPRAASPRAPPAL